VAEIKNLVEKGKPLEEAEKEELGMHHADVGAFICHLWKFPLSLVEAVQYHHAGIEILGNIQDPEPYTYIVNAACRISNLPLIESETEEREEQQEEEKKDKKKEKTKKEEPESVLDVEQLDDEFINFLKLDRNTIRENSQKVIAAANERLMEMMT